jgi:hypothetical protein
METGGPLGTREPRDPVAIRTREGADRWEEAMSYKTHTDGNRESHSGIVCAEQLLELSSDLIGGFPGPSQPTDGVASGFRLRQFVDGIDYRGRFFHLFVPATHGTHPAHLQILLQQSPSSFGHRVRVQVEKVRDLAITPNWSDSSPAYKRRCCSSSKLPNRTMAARSSSDTSLGATPADAAASAGLACAQLLLPRARVAGAV